MGMYSSFNIQEIEVRDKEKLQEIKNNKKLELHGLISDDLEVDFGNWSDHKLYSYWYNETVAVLRDLAKCIEGYAEFIYEDGFPFRIYFEEGRIYLKSAYESDWGRYKKQYFDSGR